MLNAGTRSWAVIALLALLPLTASAHHSFAATFDVATIDELEGVVTHVQWGNPHVLFTITVPNEQGKETIYEIESHSLSIMRRMDISSDALNVGDRVRVAGHPARHTDSGMFVLNALLPDGREIVFDPLGGPRWAENIGSTEIWQATEQDAVAQRNGIFRVWSTTFSAPGAFPFPEIFDPSLNNRYPLTDGARAALAAFNPQTDTPTLSCAPKGMPTIMEQPYPLEFVDQGGTIVLRMEEYDTVRTIHMNEPPASPGTPASRLGYSVGHWEGNTLVVC